MPVPATCKWRSLVQTCKKCDCTNGRCHDVLFRFFLQTTFSVITCLSKDSSERLFLRRNLWSSQFHKQRAFWMTRKQKKHRRSSLKRVRNFLWFLLFFRDWFFSLNVPHYSCLWRCCLLDRKIFSSLMNVFNDQLKGYIRINKIKGIRAFNLNFICRNWTIWLIRLGFSCARNRSSYTMQLTSFESPIIGL